MESAKIYRLNRERPATSPAATPANSSASPQKPKLLDQVRQAIRTRHYSYRTEKAYVHWIKRYILFHNKRHPLEMAEPEIGQFLSSLATEGRVSARRKTKPSMRSYFFIRTCWVKRSDSSRASCGQRGHRGCRSCSRKTKSRR
jgi:Phage integrase, N-terminal SAM-like domain